MFKNQDRNQEVACIERLRVQRVLIALANGAGQGGGARLRAQLAAEVEIDLASLPAPARITADELVAMSQGNAAAFGFTAEATSLPEIEVSGRRARAVSYGHSFHARPVGLDQNLWLLYCRYEHELTRGEDGWRVTAIKMRPVPAAPRVSSRKKRAKAAVRALAR
jgi:hypothetical protein